ncbi:flagellar hook-associated protein FlgK [Rhizobium mayense]|uniref:Flagellar hook-associated protein 1 n=1 Tax=Rhizobium mayense TaxID=1312184 RepID=A0ABT7JYN7_9HYPH|nr:flagellar hook-associated protein FlgK [Rhizobium mayense]MDL2401461.1 flagellar hook-associated protein FlgK [Rhizobium mayense]
MSLTTALNNAQAIFNNTGTQSSVVSNNIANAGNADYTRRQAMLTTDMSGAQVVKIARADEPSLQKAFLGSTSDDAAQQRLLKGYEDIQSGTIGGNNNEIAPATYLAALQTAMQTFAGSPSSITAAQSAINAAQDLSNSLNNATTAVNGIRTDADKEISSDVSSLNSLLAQFEQANDAVKTATATAGPTSSALSDAMDQRDSVLKQISQIVGVTTVTRPNGDMALYTSGGATLFETIPRQVTFTPTNSYTDGTVGNNVYIDGVVLDPGQGADTTAQGSLQAALQVRDDVAPTYQKQLDEISRGLVTMFSEKNQADSSQPALPGLFTWSGGTVPTDTTAVAGMAGTIAVNPALITSQGGDPTLLRDGGINGSDYVVNSSGDSGYSGLLDSYVTGMDTKMNFDPNAGSDTTASIMDYASASIGWLEDQRSSANTAAENTSAALSRSSEVYSNETGVNLDEELTLMMDIEQSYKAGTKILNAVNQMLQSVLDIAS